MPEHQRKENIHEKYVVYYTFGSLIFFYIIIEMSMVYYITDEEIVWNSANCWTFNQFKYIKWKIQ